MKRNIILVGSTGHGKSSLGNVLCHNAETEPTEVFPVGDGASSTTSSIHSKEFTFLFKEITQSINLVDTPGLNDSRGEDADVDHMCEVVHALNNCKHVSAVIFVCKLGMWDGQMKATVKYYAELLGGILHSSCVLVITNVGMSPQDEKRREKNKQSIEKIVSDSKKFFCELTLMKPTAICIDSQPVSEEEILFTREARRQILELACEFPVVDVKDILLAKPPAILADHKLSIQELHGKIDGYSQRMIDAEPKLAKCFSELKEWEETKGKRQVEVNDLEAKIADMDTQNLVQIQSFEITENWGFWSKEKEFTIAPSPKRPIRSFSVTSKSRYTKVMDVVQSGECELKGKACSPNFRGCFANIVLFTWKSDFYAEEIKEAKSQLALKRKDLHAATLSCGNISESHKEHQVSIETLTKECDVLRKRIVRFQAKTISLPDAQAFLYKRRYREKFGCFPPPIKLCKPSLKAAESTKEVLKAAESTKEVTKEAVSEHPWAWVVPLLVVLVAVVLLSTKLILRGGL